MFGLTSQVRRVAVPSNIAEGQGRHSSQAFINHLSIAYGSLQEVETQILIAHRLAYLAYIDSMTLERVMTDAREIARMLNGLQRSLRKPASSSDH